MKSLLTLTARVCEHDHSVVRFTPVDYIPIEQRRKLVEALVVDLWSVADNLGVDLGRPPTLMVHECNFDPADVLKALSELNVSLLRAHHTLGTAKIARDGVEEIIDRTLISNFTPNFRAIIADTKEEANGVGGHD